MTKVFIVLISFSLLIGWTILSDAVEELNRLESNESKDYVEFLPKANIDDYRLGPGDVININIDFLQDISKSYTISETGNITFPTLLPPLKVQGLTIEQLQFLLTKLLEEYMHEPKLTLSIAEYHSHKVLILGPFQRPGKQELKMEKVPLLDIITEAGGLREIRENDELVILRSNPSLNPSPDNSDEPRQSMQTIRVNLQRLIRDGDLTQNVMIQSGDVIYITSFFTPNQYIYVAGGSQRGAGAILYEHGLTAFKALLRAGVAPDDPQVMDVMIVRGQDSNKPITTSIKFDPANPGVGDVPLMPEDIVILPRDSSQVAYVAGEVNSPGTLPYREGLTVLQAILDVGGMSKKAVGSKAKVLREDEQGRRQIPADMDAILEKGDKTQNIALMVGDIIVVPGTSLQEDITVTGKVNNPGIVPYEQEMTTMKAIFMAGGLSGNALQSQIRVMKQNGEVLQPFLLDISKAQVGEAESSNPVLKPGDLIVVMGPSPGNVISVLGKVRRPGIIDFTDGMTVLQAVLQSGGFDQGAARSKVKIVGGAKAINSKISASIWRIKTIDPRIPYFCPEILLLFPKRSSKQFF